MIRSILKGLRCYHTTGPLFAVGGKAMKKILNRSTMRKKNKFYESPALPEVTSSSVTSTSKRCVINHKRAAVFNKLFMRHITDLMMSGNCASAFVGHGLEILKVKVTPDFNIINVFWIAKNSTDEEVVAKILDQNAGPLRHELSQLKVVGVVPRINFVKDKKYSIVRDVEAKLSIADYGDDHEPTQPVEKLKAQLELFTKLDPQMKEEIEDISQSVPFDEEVIPPMPNNIFGLDHTRIMERIRSNVKKSIPSHRRNPEAPAEMPLTINPNPLQYQSNKEQKEILRKFLLKRQQTKRKLCDVGDSREDIEGYLQENQDVEDVQFEDEVLEDLEDFSERR